MQRQVFEGADKAGDEAERRLRHVSTVARDTRPDIEEALYVLRQRKWSILGIAVVVVALALVVSSRRTPIYQAEASVLVTPLEGASEVPTDPNLATEAVLAGSVAVAEVVAERLGLDDGPRDLLSGLSVDSPEGTEILELSYRHSNPAEARQLAQAFAEGYLEYRRRTATEALVESAEAIRGELAALERRLERVEGELAGTDEDDPRFSNLESEASLLQGLILQRQLDELALRDRVSVGDVVEPAAEPSTPTSPNHVVNAGFGLAAGLALGIGLAFLRDRLSGRLRTDDEVETYLGASVLGTIPRVPAWRKGKEAFLVTRTDWRSPAAEAYRIVRANLLSVASAYEAKSILVTSAHTGEGKTATVANLGVVFARAGKRTVVVSADLRRPRLHSFFNSRHPIGLADVLAGRAPLTDALVSFQYPQGSGLDNLRLVPTGSIPDNPAELLTSGNVIKVLKELESIADIVLIDAPPVLPVSDALVLAPLVQGMVLVIGPRSATRSSVTSARQQMEKVGARVLGGVLNGPEAGMTQGYYTY